MRFELETRRRERGEITWTSIDLKHARALPAPKVMMMRRTGSFVARRLTREFDWNEPTRFNKRVDRAIHGRDAQTVHV